MKKLCAVMMTLVMLMMLTGQADAAELGQVNLKNKATIKALKNGTMTIKGVKLGQSLSTAKKKWGKDYFEVASTYQHYDMTLTYETYGEDEYEEESTFEAYFHGQRGMKPAQYKLLYFDYSGSGAVLKYKDMLKYWGKPDFHYVTAGQEIFFYGQAALVYDDYDGQYLGYKYVAKNAIKSIKKTYLK